MKRLADATNLGPRSDFRYAVQMPFAHVLSITELQVFLEPLERAAQLKLEADLLMREVRLAEILRPYGKAIPIGSYFLDVMVYPDLDIMIPKISIAQLFQIGARLAESEKVFQVVFEKSRDPGLPGGLYLKPRIDLGDWGRPWKIDIWSLHRETITEQLAIMRAFKNVLTPESREQIICYKLSILTHENRTPMYSGFWIYKAFLDEGLRDFGEVTRYLAEHGIALG